jgi:amidophosphoribosyltransferase
MSDSPREACGIVGVYTPDEDAARAAFFGLFSLQHRGQESAGIATADGRNHFHHTGMGLVAQAFHEFDLVGLPGHIAIGHTRYSTMGSSNENNAQPIQVEGIQGYLALAHNGNVINAFDLRDELVRDWGCKFTTSTDSEVIAHLLANTPGQTWAVRLASVMRRLRGAYSLTVLLPDSLLAIRDPLGVRPLCLGKLNGGWIVASESCALDHIGAQFIREIEPGEALLINQNGVKTVYQVNEGKKALCVFETIYFARPDSILDRTLVYATRQEMGRQLAREHPVEADLVIGIPDSATAAGIGYAEESGIPYREGLIKNRYVGRTFIEPDQRIRDLGVRLKFNPLPEVLLDQRVVVVDDSIVRGTTTGHVVNLLRRAGCREVHMRVCAPPIISPCHFGVDFSTRQELIAARMNLKEICIAINADSLGYLSMPGLFSAIGRDQTTYCSGCFTNQYPIDVQLDLDKLALEQTQTEKNTA